MAYVNRVDMVRQSTFFFGSIRMTELGFDNFGWSVCGSLFTMYVGVIENKHAKGARTNVMSSNCQRNDYGSICLG